MSASQDGLTATQLGVHNPVGPAAGDYRNFNKQRRIQIQLCPGRAAGFRVAVAKNCALHIVKQQPVHAVRIWADKLQAAS
jgi:hypothetical protein